MTETTTEQNERAWELLRSSLATLVGGRIDGAYANPESGLVVISVYVGEKKLFGVGIGPHATGVGWLPRLPNIRADASHPLVAAMRAHLCDHRVRATHVEDGTIWISAGGKDAIARLSLMPGRHGEARVIAQNGNVVVRWPPRNTQGGTFQTEQRWQPRGDDFAAAGAALVETSDRWAIERARTALLRAVRQRIQAMERRAEAVRNDLARLESVGQLQKIGRLLLAQGDQIPRGASRATLQDWEEGGTIEVTLDPARPAKAQAETFFARARRYQRGEAVMRRRLDEAMHTAAALRSLADEMASATLEGKQALEALVARAHALGVSEVRERLPSHAPGKIERRPYHRFRGAGGRAILVGRGAKDNDELITRYARPHDLWLHAKDVTGAHVVVPLEKGQSCPPDLLVDAATLAAHFSDARGERAVDVSYVERRYVRKPRGSAPGAVTYDHEKVMTVRIEPERLERLLASREE